MANNIEQFRQLPINPRSVRFSRRFNNVTGGAFAEGRDKYEGHLFSYGHKVDTLEQALSEKGQREFPVLGVAVQLEESNQSNKLKFDVTGVGLWHIVRSEVVLNWWRNNYGKIT
jgi:hypothetical protein